MSVHQSDSLHDDHNPAAEVPATEAAGVGLPGDTLGIDAVLARRMLDFEKKWLAMGRRGPAMAGIREETVRQQFPDEFGGSSIRYHQVLNRLIDTPAAESAEPILIHQLRRLRDGDQSR